MDYDNPYASPLTESTLGVEQLQTQRKDLAWLLFSFQGRIPRRNYWAVSIISTLLMYVVFVPVALLTGEAAFVVLFLLVCVPMFWIWLANAVKRWHDRDKSGLWVLIGLIPYLGGIWILIECGCLRGTPGPNRFGDDPT
jgi:uncharacterized membrane protein YhaH (DUF805 family)